ncbi:phage antirepressor N-terminal domain-containing protein [Rothia nasimurium]|uniref:phage antirepressor N-terminal domain-containing protein n=1 Tax=Rothia nasimurium TaxID=85336 RepID=UPI001F1613F9|nr:phage antirepressor N-terminal domain-containing protein [Rothia nasimurium]
MELIKIENTPGLQVVEEEFIALKPMCDALGISFASQTVKLREKSWATVSKIETVGADGKTREMTALHKDAVPMWLAALSENKVKPEARPVLIAYQKEAAKALNDYFTTGSATRFNVQVKEIEVAQFKEQALQLACQSQLNALQAAKGLVHPDHLEAKARVVLARSLHEVPELDPARTPLYTTDFLKEKNLSRSQMKRAGQFGKEVKKAYISEHGVEPGKSPLTLANGQVRQVLAYTEADRPLFEQVFARYFGQFLLAA